MELYQPLLSDLGKTEWPELLEKLQENADPFARAIQNYLEAADTAKTIEQSYYENQNTQSATENADHRERIRQAQWRQYCTHRDLGVLIYGRIDWPDLHRYVKNHPYEEI
jgi:hypothetical protein